MTKQLTSLTNELHRSGSIKVWSLIITFFGDSIVNRGGNVSASTVQTVFNQMDIGSGALRTAFSRLASDGWVDRQKQGRRSYYQLTQAGRNPFSQAAKRIYAPVLAPQPSRCDWTLAIHHDKRVFDEMSCEQLVRLPNRTALLFDADKATLKQLRERGFLSVTGECRDVPDWVIKHLCPPDWADQVAILQKSFRQVAARPPSDPLLAIATRTLLIHQWRRLLLRYPALPAELKGDSLALENECREFVGRLYAQLTGPAEIWLSDHGVALNGPLPSSKINPVYRFTTRYKN